MVYCVKKRAAVQTRSLFYLSTVVTIASLCRINLHAARPPAVGRHCMASQLTISPHRLPTTPTCAVRAQLWRVSPSARPGVQSAAVRPSTIMTESRNRQELQSVLYCLFSYMHLHFTISVAITLEIRNAHISASFQA